MTDTGTSSSVGSAVQPAWPDLWDADEHGPYLVGTRCARCGGVALGVRDVCPHCLNRGEGLARDRLGRRGRIYTATTIHQAPPGFEVPLRVGYVDLEDDVRIFTHIEQGEHAPVIGGEVELAIETVKTDTEGRALSGPVYRNAFRG